MKLLTLCLVLLNLSFPMETNAQYNPPDYVPDQKTALTIAEAVMVPIYGERVLKQRPFKVTLVDGRWIIKGTLHCPKDRYCNGGTVHLEINKKTAEVLKAKHSR